MALHPAKLGMKALDPQKFVGRQSAAGDEDALCTDRIGLSPNVRKVVDRYISAQRDMIEGVGSDRLDAPSRAFRFDSAPAGRTRSSDLRPSGKGDRNDRYE